MISAELIRKLYYESRFKVLQALYDYITILFSYINYKY